MTPEGKVKARVNKVLDTYKPELWRYMPVPGGFGKQALDYICCYKGVFFSIETKRPGGTPTDKQLGTIEDIEKADGKVFMIDGDNGQLEELEQWLRELSLQSWMPSPVRSTTMATRQ